MKGEVWKIVREDVHIIHITKVTAHFSAVPTDVLYSVRPEPPDPTLLPATITLHHKPCPSQSTSHVHVPTVGRQQSLCPGTWRQRES